MRYTVSFKDGLANICLEATLPLPELHPECTGVHGDKHQLPAIYRIEALLPEFLSEQIFLRTQGPGDRLTDHQAHYHSVPPHTRAQT